MKQIDLLRKEFNDSGFRLAKESTRRRSEELMHEIFPDISNEQRCEFEMLSGKGGQWPKLAGPPKRDIRSEVGEALMIVGVCDQHNVKRIVDQLFIQSAVLGLIDYVIRHKAEARPGRPDFIEPLRNLHTQIPDASMQKLDDYLTALETEYSWNNVRYLAAVNTANAWLEQHLSYKDLPAGIGNTVPNDLDAGAFNSTAAREFLCDHLIQRLLTGKKSTRGISAGWGSSEYEVNTGDNTLLFWLQRELAAETVDLGRGSRY